MLRISRLLFIPLFIFSLTAFPVASPLQAEPFNHSVRFIVNFSESMKEKIDDESKQEMVMELFDVILENAEPADAELIFFGHRDKDSCDDAEVVVPSEKFSAETVRKMLSETTPSGKGGLIAALNMASEKLDEKTDLLSIIIITDGTDTCEVDLLKTAKEIREKYDYRITFNVIGMPGDKKGIGNVAILPEIGYGSFVSITRYPFKDHWIYKQGMDKIEEQMIKNIGIAVARQISAPERHSPRTVGNDDMVLIPAGEFLMGSDSPYFTSPSERPAHTVFVDSFFIDKYAVTQRQYRDVIGENPSFWIGSDLPVHNVSWYDAKTYCEKVGKRLPTEAEWEKAARGRRNDNWSGTSDAGSLGEYAWIDDTSVSPEKRSGGRVRPVGTKNPNGYGIYDMSGNVWEWVSDWFGDDYYRTSPKSNPQGPEKGVGRVIRGGSWDSHPIEVRSAARRWMRPDYKDWFTGIRCVKSAE
jgi:formylglycine-generating enzyme